MTTRSFWILGSLLALMVIVGLFSFSNTVIALALPLIVYLGFAVLQAPGEPKLKATRVLNTDRITQGMDIEVSLEVANEGPHLPELHLSENMDSPQQFLAGNASQVTTLSAGESIHYDYTLKSWRGNYRFETLLATVNDPFGLLEIQKQLPARGNVLVYPETETIKPIPIRPPHTKGFSGPIPSRKSGTGMDFFGVRQYQLGDSLRHVNWKTSARYTVDLFTNEYEQERIADIGLILDARPHSKPAPDHSRLFEYSIRATASLAEMFLSEGHCLSLLVYSAAVTRVFPGYGKVQRERILKALATADTGINYAMEHLQSFPARLLPPKGQLVYISPLAADDFEPIMRFRAQGYEVLILSPDPLDFEQQHTPNTSQSDFRLASRYARIERELLFKNLHRVGIQVINWQVSQPLSSVLEKVRLQNSLSLRTARALQ